MLSNYKNKLILSLNMFLTAAYSIWLFINLSKADPVEAFGDKRQLKS